MAIQIKNKKDLREEAEKVLANKLPINDKLSELEMEALIHELQVHQVQLKMQNEELTQIQEELQIARDTFYDLYNFAAVGYLTINSKGEIEEANLSAAEMFGVTRQYILGKKVYHFIAAESQDTFYLHCNAIAKQTKGSNICELQFKRISESEPAFSTFWVQLNCSFVKLNPSEPPQLKVSLTDISDLKRVQQEKIDAQQLVAKNDKLASIGKVAGDIAHDFNNLLTIVMGQSEISMMSCDDKEITQSFTTILEQCDRGRHLTKELTLYAKNNRKAPEKRTFKNIPIYSNKYVLIVEDEDHISDVQRQVLTGSPFNHNVEIAKDGHSALELIKKNRYDFITLDYILPGKFNGKDIYEHIRLIDRTVPVLFISGNMKFLESIISLKQNDINIDHLGKPHNIEEYTTYVNRLIGLAFDKQEEA